jgi:putative redox protein
MKIEIDRIDEAYRFEAKNELGQSVIMDSSTEHGGHDLGFRPMQMLLAGIGGCSGIDVIDILKKQRQDFKDIKITVTAEREQGKVPALFTKVHLHYRFFGEIDEEKAKKALDLSIQKYCSVAKIIEKTAEITYSFEILESE